VRQLLRDLDGWREQGKQVVLARVVDVEGSGPRDAGAAMAVSEDGEVLGSVSGGCVEGAVVAEALDVLATGERRIVTFGYSDEDAFAVGLTCGGTVHLYLEPLDWPAVDDVPFEALRDAVAAHRNCVLVTVIDGPGRGDKVLLLEGEAPLGRLRDPELHRIVLRDATAALAAGTTSTRHFGPQGQTGEDAVTVFVEAFAPPPRLLIFGAVDFTAALVRVAKVLGYHVTVCDAREVFATRVRFPSADEVVVDWPHRHLAKVAPPLGPRDAVCVLTHDAKFDVPAIAAALATDVGYLGAMGSRRTTERRAEQLRAEGVSDEQLVRLLAPIGLDLGARTPEETAVAICAEMIAQRTGRTAPRLRDAIGPIH
jgi:xanthine dehydrogenase accessory factor